MAGYSAPVHRIILQRRGGVLGTGTRGEGEEEEGRLETGASPEDQGCRGPPPEQQDVKAVSARHCAATSVLRNCCPNRYAEHSHKDNVRSSAVGNLPVRVVVDSFYTALISTLEQTHCTLIACNSE